MTSRVDSAGPWWSVVGASMVCGLRVLHRDQVTGLVICELKGSSQWSNDWVSCLHIGGILLEDLQVNFSQEK